MKKCFYWANKASNNGSGKGQAFLGQLYYRGHGVKQDYKKALSNYIASEEKGILVCQTIIGQMYLNGTGVEKNIKEGLYWIKKAANRGDSKGQRVLGYLYMEGGFYRAKL